jgi:centromeric protein E
VSSVVNGINGTIFAYGQTSSGKTHTMQGGGDSIGVLQLAAEEIFSLIEANDSREYILRVAYMEIYNENLRDLLSADGNSPVQIREDPKLGVYIQCREEVISCFGDIQDCLRRGEQFRVVGATAMNERSSRSHAIFRLTVRCALHKNSTMHARHSCCCDR